MKTKSFFITAVVTLSLATATIAQNVPNYLPTNGLVGWWPFNGNANDQSGNNNNGTVNGASLTTDRFGNSNKAYSFDGSSTNIEIPSNQQLNLNTSFTISFWLKKNSNSINMGLISKERLSGGGSYLFQYDGTGQYGFGINNDPGGCLNCNIGISSGILTQVNEWDFIVGTWDNTNLKFYLNNNLLNQGSATLGNGGSLLSSNFSLFFGKYLNSFCNGKLDDIGIWNRALTPQEISDLYNAVNCNNNLAITPQNNVVQIGNTPTFNATTSDANPNYIWQSDFGQGFQTLNNYGNYSGVNTNAFAVANVQLANHNQAIRAISTSGNCIDTSNVAYITIADTCITNVTVYDTVTTYISVTDTLFINVNTISLNNTTIITNIKVFPNPANSNLNLDFGNFNTLNGYSIKIYNSLSQVIYNQAITQQSQTIDLSTFGGNGIYFLHLINAQNNTVDIRKIVLQ